MKVRYAVLWVYIVLFAGCSLGYTIATFLIGQWQGWLYVGIVLVFFAAMVPLFVYKKSRPSFWGSVKLFLLGLLFTGVSAFVIIMFLSMIAGMLADAG